MRGGYVHLAELEQRVREKALEELRLRRRLGHTAGCLCGRNGVPCCRLRQMVGWRAVEEVFGELPRHHDRSGGTSGADDDPDGHPGDDL